MKKNNDVGILLIRIAVAAIFLYAGIYKLTNMDMVVGFFGSMGLAPFWAYLVAIVETLGGLAVLLGAFICSSSALLAIIMIVAIFTTGISKGFSAHELEIVMLLASVALMFTGAGKYSIAKKKTEVV